MSNHQPQPYISQATFSRSQSRETRRLADKSEKASRTVMVAGLVECNDEARTELFLLAKRYGELNEAEYLKPLSWCRAKNKSNPTRPANSWLAFLEYLRAEDAKRAVSKLDGMIFRGHEIRAEQKRQPAGMPDAASPTFSSVSPPMSRRPRADSETSESADDERPGSPSSIGNGSPMTQWRAPMSKDASNVVDARYPTSLSPVVPPLVLGSPQGHAHAHVHGHPHGHSHSHGHAAQWAPGPSPATSPVSAHMVRPVANQASALPVQAQAQAQLHHGHGHGHALSHAHHGHAHTGHAHVSAHAMPHSHSHSAATHPHPHQHVHQINSSMAGVAAPLPTRSSPVSVATSLSPHAHAPAQVIVPLTSTSSAAAAAAASAAAALSLQQQQRNREKEREQRERDRRTQMALMTRIEQIITEHQRNLLGIVDATLQQTVQDSLIEACGALQKQLDQLRIAVTAQT